MLKIDTIYKRGILFVRLYGVINNSNKNEIENTLESAINKVGIKYLLLNFEDVYYNNVDLSLIINKWSKILTEKEGKFFLCGYDRIWKNNLVKVENIVETQDEFSAYNIINI